MEEKIYDRLVNKEAKLAVIGLGYVGLPIALEFAKKIKVVGFDINAERINLMRNKIDPSYELEPSDFEGCDIVFTHELDELKDVQFFIVAVPTPIDASKKPNIKPKLLSMDPTPVHFTALPKAFPINIIKNNVTKNTPIPRP